MDQTMSYSDILTRVIREEAREQPSIQPIRITSSCDHETGEFLLIATGWENKRRVDYIPFHVRLVDGLVVIETDNIEDGLKTTLIEAGISEEDIVSGLKYGRQQPTKVAA